ncbi:hypothetical protein SPONN_618 [uncultured Candidatus Thioglobus sp.]|nr:hypothetical protein SPONN_618 [uncultured Candidatus Thioglobus sp.]
MKLIILIVGILTCASVVYAADEYSTEHQQMIMQKESPLTEAGNDIFGTIQEVITNLNANLNTDWDKVNIEALKEHLLDMRDMTVNVEVINQNKLKNGSEILIRPTNKRSIQAMKRVLSAHPAQLKKETNWQMQVQKQGDKYLLITTTDKPTEVSKIIGLGYIGLMAHGSHHQPHHWSMATGNNPHSH